MTRLSISLDNQLADQVRTAAGDNVSGWLSVAARQRLLADAVQAEITHDATHGDDGWSDERTAMWDHG